MGPTELPVFEGHHHTIFDLLAARDLIGSASLKTAFDEHQATGKPFATRLIELSLIGKPALLRAVAEHLGCDYAEKLLVSVPAETVRVIEAGLARTYGVMPVAIDALALTLLVTDPFNPHLLGELTFALAREVQLAVADPESVRLLIRQYYGDESPSPVALPMQLPEAVVEPAESQELSEADIEKMAGKTPIIRFVNLVLAQAIRDGAADIHFEPFAREFKIRYRIDGALCEMTPPARTLALPIVSRLKVLANLNIAERRLPQDGRINLNFSGRAVDLHISTLPTQFGESVVLRVLDQSSGQLELGEIGLPDAIRSGVSLAHLD